MKMKIKRLGVIFLTILSVILCAFSLSSCVYTSANVQLQGMMYDDRGMYTEITLTFKAKRTGTYAVRGAVLITEGNGNIFSDDFRTTLEVTDINSSCEATTNIYGASNVKAAKLASLYVYEEEVKHSDYTGLAIGLGVGAGVLLAGLTAYFVVDTVKSKKKK